MFGRVLLFSILQLCSATTQLVSREALPDNDLSSEGQTIERDFCIIGGGSSGTYAATRLKDLNYSIAIVERNNYLGGHTYTYIDPTTNAPYDFGVQYFHPIPVVYDYFAKFDIPLINTSAVIPNAPGQPANASIPAILYQTFSEYIDFETGQLVQDIGAQQAGLPNALENYLGLLEQYPYLTEGWDLPYPVPEDLLLPFGSFIAKYNLSSLVQLEWSFSAGVGNLLDATTVYVAKLVGIDTLVDLSIGFLTSASGDNSELYQKAQAYIGNENIFFDSSIISTDRFNTTSEKAELLITTPAADTQLLSCSNILLTIPPTTSNLEGWDLTPTEASLFSQFGFGRGYWTSLVSNVGLNYTFSYNNRDPSQAPYELPVLPAVYNLVPTGNIPDTWVVQYGSPTSTLTDEQVQAAIVDEIQVLQRASGVPVTEPTFVIFQSHSPFELQVSADAIADGFYRNLTALQGTNKMYYTGAAFHTHDSSLLWRFVNDTLLPLITGD